MSMLVQMVDLMVPMVAPEAQKAELDRAQPPMRLVTPVESFLLAAEEAEAPEMPMAYLLAVQAEAADPADILRRLSPELLTPVEEAVADGVTAAMRTFHLPAAQAFL